MKQLLLCFITITLLLTLGCSKSNSNLKSYIKGKVFNKNKKGTISVKVDNIPVSVQEIREEMEISLGYDYSENDLKRVMADDNLKKAYEEKVINQYLVMKSMLKNNEFNDEDFEKYLWVAVKEAIVKYYLYKNFFKNNENNKWKDIMITADSEVLDFYEKNKSFFDAKEVKQDDALYAIKSDIQQRKTQVFMVELTKFQKDLMNQLKSELKIEKLNN